MIRPEDANIKAGDLLAGKYRVARLIGRGGMGIVVEATNELLHERVAIKVLHTRYVENKEAMTRFKHEARAAVRVRGEHSVRLLDVGETSKGAPFLVMELLEGIDFAELLKQGKLGIKDAVIYVLEACVGVAEIHASGIIHRDLKPGNLFLTRRPDSSPLVKVLDFGIAKSSIPFDDAEPGSVTMTLIALGTPLYMSPEQVRSSRTVDARADVWSLGAILYELLSGIPAFGGNTVSNITAQILEATPPALDKVRAEVPSKLDKVVQTALAKKPEQRYGDVAELAAALAPFGGDMGPALAERASRILKTGGRAALTPAPMPTAGSLAPGSSTTIDAELATRIFVRPRARGAMPFIIGGLVLATIGGGFGVLRASSTNTVEIETASKGIAARAVVAAAVVRTAARLGPKDTSTHANEMPALSPNELPDVVAPAPQLRGPMPHAPATAAPKKTEEDDDPLSVRR